MGKVKLQKLCGILSGYAFDSQQFTEKSSDMPLIRIRDVVRGHTKTYTKEKYDEKYVIKKDDLLIGMDGEFNIATWKSKDALLNQRVCKIYATSNKLFEKYLFYFLPAALKKIEAAASFVTVKHLSVKQINEIEIPLPPPEVQRKIAETLDAASELLAMRKNQLAELEKLIQSVFYDMFGESNYSSKKLYELCEFITKGTTPHASKIFEEFREDSIPYLKVYHLTFNGKLNFSFRPAYISKETHEKSLTRSKVFPNDVLMNIVGPPLGKISIVPKTFNEWNVNQAIAIFRCKEVLNPKFLLYSLLRKTTLEPIINSAIGIRQQNLSLKQCREIEIPLPPMKKQTQFAETVQEIEEQKALVQKAIDETQALFDSLMNEYFE